MAISLCMKRLQCALCVCCRRTEEREEGGGNRCGKGLKGVRGTRFFLGGLGELGFSRRTRGAGGF